MPVQTESPKGNCLWLHLAGLGTVLLMHGIGFSQTAGEAGHPGSLPHPRGDRATWWLWTTEGVPGLSVCSRGGQDVAGDPEVCVCVGGVRFS